MKSFPCRVPIFLLLVISATASAQSSRVQALRDDKGEIARLEERWLKAIETADIATLDSILAEDFVRPAPEAKQFVTKSQLLDHFKMHKVASTGSRKIEDLTVTLYGTTAIARGSFATYVPSGQAVSRNLFTDVFVYRDGRWQAVSAQENATASLVAQGLVGSIQVFQLCFGLDSGSASFTFRI